MTRSAFALIFALILAPTQPALSEASVASRPARVEWAQTNTDTVDRTLTMQPGGTLRLKTFSGRVRITGGSGDQVVIHAVRRGRQDRLDDIKLEITQSGNTVEVDANHRVVERRNDNVVETDFDIQVPARTRLDIKTFSAPVTVIGVSESQKIDGFSSDIRIEASQWGDGNSLDINTFRGAVSIRR